MKRYFIIVFVQLFYSFPCGAQFRGGAGDGLSRQSSESLNLLPILGLGGFGDGWGSVGIEATNQLPSFYNGGTGDGVDQLEVLNVNQQPSYFFGGAGDGFHLSETDSLNPLTHFFLGGSGDGQDQSAALHLNVLPDLFAGGADDGFDLSFRPNGNPSCEDDWFVWTGAVDEDWHNAMNWECRVAPGLYSHVYIPEGLTQAGRPYPIVYLYAEVSAVELKPGAYLQVDPGVVLRLNGK